MPEPTFTVTANRVSFSRADQPILVDVSLRLTERTRAAVIGPNGVGKSTLLRVLAGTLTPDNGSVTAAPPSLTVGLLQQEPAREAGGETVRDVIARTTGVAAAEKALERAATALGAEGDDDDDDADEDGDEGAGVSGRVETAADGYERALERYLQLGVADFDARLEVAADQTGLRSDLLDADVGRLSGGEAERMALTAVMLSRFDLTLLDEPTNNLDLDGLDLLEHWVNGHDGGLVVVSHDRAFLERTISSVIEIDHHHRTVEVYEGGWTSFLDERERVRRQAEERYGTYVSERDRLAGRAQQQREWVDRGASRARKRPADNDVFRKRFAQAQTERLAAKSKATLRAMERLEEVDKPWEPWQLRFEIATADRSADVVVSFRRAVLGRGDFRLGPLDHEIRWADRLAVVGPNGSGKSTFIEALTGRLSPVSGTVQLGSGVALGELDQARLTTADGSESKSGSQPKSESESESATVLADFQARTDLVHDEARSLLAKFGLGADAIPRPVVSLSPGERTRYQLAEFQARSVNLLVLDEPTNHLDLEAIEQLESALESFSGTVVLVTHDRRLLDTVSLTHTLDLTGLAVRADQGRSPEQEVSDG